MSGEVLHGLAPVIGRETRLVVLGSFPSVASLQAQQYYAHPRNQFWDLMGDLFGAGRDLRYPRRLAALRRAGVALWDVLAECEREGSLDSAIRRERVHDLGGLLRRCPRIGVIAFNGQPAARLFRRHVRDLPRPVRFVVLPSSSPAHALRTPAAKQARWRALLADIVISRRIT